MSSPWSKEFLLAVECLPCSFMCFLLSHVPSIVSPGPPSCLDNGFVLGAGKTHLWISGLESISSFFSPFMSHLLITRETSWGTWHEGVGLGGGSQHLGRRWELRYAPLLAHQLVWALSPPPPLFESSDLFSLKCESFSIGSWDQGTSEDSPGSVLKPSE